MAETGGEVECSMDLSAARREERAVGEGDWERERRVKMWDPGRVLGGFLMEGRGGERREEVNRGKVEGKRGRTDRWVYIKDVELSTAAGAEALFVIAVDADGVGGGGPGSVLVVEGCAGEFAI